MKFTPHILGAVAIVAIAGAVSGATIGESPVVERGLTESTPEAPIVRASNTALRDAKRLPDHYPLHTPNGTIEVAELALHGRLRDRGGELWLARRSDDYAYVNRGASGYGVSSYEAANTEPIKPPPRRFALSNTQASSSQVRLDDASQPLEKARKTRAEAPMALAGEVVTVHAKPVVEPLYGTARGTLRTADDAGTPIMRDK